MARGSVMNATMRIIAPHRGHTRGSTSKRRQRSSAHRRRSSRRSGSAGGGDHLAGRPVRGPAEPAKEGAVEQKVLPQHLGDGEHPLGVADIGEHLLAEKRGERGSALGGARWAQAAAFAGEGHEELCTACSATHASEAIGQNAAVEVGANGRVCEAAPETVSALVPLLPRVRHVGIVGLDEPVQRRRLRAARAVDGAVRSGHGLDRLVAWTGTTIVSLGGVGRQRAPMEGQRSKGATRGRGRPKRPGSAATVRVPGAALRCGATAPSRDAHDRAPRRRRWRVGGRERATVWWRP